MVRTCFSSQWRLHSDPSILSAGRLVRLPPTCRALDFPHPFGSRDWTSDDEFWPDARGEWEGARKYYSGEPPDEPLGSHFAGHPGVAMEGDPDPEMPLWEMRNGFPVECYVESECAESFAKTDVTSANVWKNFATVICQLYTDGPLAANTLQSLFPEITDYRLFWDGGPLFPPWNIVAKTPCQIIIVCAGTANFGQIAAQALYAATGPQNIGPFSTVRLWYDAAQYLARQISDMGGGGLPIFMAGHSYGGAACAVLAGLARWRNPTGNVRLLTYGMPRPGNRAMTNIIATVPQTHLATLGDPIPNCRPIPTGSTIWFRFSAISSTTNGIS